MDRHRGADENGVHPVLKIGESESIIWRGVHFTFNMPPPTNIKNMFGNWLIGIDKSAKPRIRIGVCALV
jgi:hypothetical protein